jgi:N-acetylmuramoyl-L-alanine amidase
MAGHAAPRPRRPIGVTVVVAAVLVVLAAAVTAGLVLSGGRTPAATSRPRLRPRSNEVGGASATSSPTTTTRPPALAGKVVGIDPGHDGGNFATPTAINRLVWNGREQETCDTTGTETDGGYTEAQYNFDVAQYLAADLTAEGAKVVMTRTSNTGVGPCVTTRAQIINDAHADVAIDIHADGGPPTGRGFAVLEPVADGPNDGVIVPSEAFGSDVRTAFLSTGMPISTYDGTDGVVYRDDLAGLNLTMVPKVLIECGNMRNATDAALLVTPAFQQAAAAALASAITAFLTGTPPPATAPG